MNWINVTERLPDAEQLVLLHVPDVHEPVWLGEWVECDEDDPLGPDSPGEWRCAAGQRLPDVTHWMPLPEPPTKHEANHAETA